METSPKLNLSDSVSPLFSTVPIVNKQTPPVIVVGLPRSGSSFLAHVLSCMNSLYVFDDLYPYQGAKALGLNGNLTSQQQKDFLDKLSWAARAKIRFKKKIYAFAPQCTWEDVAELESSILASFKDKRVTWSELLEEWLTRLSLHHQCHRWGYKTPQDFMHLEELSRLFPGVQFVFVMRDPRRVMASFKNLPKKRNPEMPDGESGQYHPIVYANYWKMAYQRTASFRESNPDIPVYIVKFEDLVANPEEEASKLAIFLGTSVARSVKIERTNSSFDGGTRKKITDTEAWLCERIAGSVMEEAGYSIGTLKPRVSDLPDLWETTINFGLYQAKRFVSNSRARHSIVSYVGNLFSRKLG